MFAPRPFARAALLFVAVLTFTLAAAGCGGDVAPTPAGPRDVTIVFKSETKDGKEVGLPWLEPAIGKAEAKAMIDAFAWSKTQPLRETDASGAPALYYALVYMTSRDQRPLLDQARLHHSFMPLFDAERTKWIGKAGKLPQSTDGRGAFVFAVVPGRIYNEIRKWALAGDPLFPAILLRDIPAEARNAEGSLSYEYLAHAEFRYRGMEPIRPGQAGLGTTQQPLVILTARLALKAVAEAAEEVPRLIASALGAVDRDGVIFGWGAAGAVNLRLTLQVHDTDPAWAGGTMRRAWGTGLGDPVMLPGVRVSLWSHGDATVLGLPTLFDGTTDAASTVTLRIAKNRHVDQLCIATENDAAEITDFLTEVEVCDFKGATNYGIDNLKYDTWIHVTVEDPYFNILAQATEANAYLHDVAGYAPHKATIVVGWIADAMGSFGTGAPFTPCLGFPNVSADVLVLDILGLVAAVPIVGPPLAATLAVATPLLAADMFFPSSDALKSRGVASHEYGHYAMCSMLYDANVSYISSAWTSAVADRIGSGAVPPPTSSAAFDIEAFADFFAGQTAGGTNYFAAGTLSSLDISYCDVNAADPASCLDRNFSARATFFDQVARVATTLHDAFDGDRYNSSFVNQPGNGNVWTQSGSAFVFDGSSRNGDRHDEAVLLPGAALRSFVGKLSSLGEGKFMPSLAQTIRDNGYTWCQACRVFSLHAGVPEGAPDADHYAACEAAPIAAWVGPAPDVNSPQSCNFTACPPPLVQVGLECQACPPNQIYVDPQTCKACPPGTQVVDNQCQICSGGTCTPACPERQHMVNGVCEDCPFSDVSVDGVCQPCPAGEYRYENTCVTVCPPYLDVTIIVDGVCTYELL